MPGLGRIYKPDPRDAAYPLRAAIRTLEPMPTSTTWQLGPCLDQGHTSECVGHAWQGWRLSLPIADAPAPVATPDTVATTIYAASQAIDGMPLPHDGSTVRAAAQVLADAAGPLSSAGKAPIAQYVWAQSIADVRDYLLLHGPLVVGTNWYRSMFTLDPQGFIVPSGNVVGGHAWLLYSYDSTTDVYGMRNSWGTTWGKDGCASVHGPDLERLLFAEQGECCAALEEAVI